MAHDGQLDTFERSCRHWSEDGRVGMDAFYQLATIDYRLLAEQLHWGRVLEFLKPSSGGRIQLLDVACGSGQFPAALLEYGGLDSKPAIEVAYSLLDPSRFSIDTARSRLQPPFSAAEEFECTIQEFQAPAKKYKIAWATHALYCVPPSELGLAMEQMLNCLDESGVGFIAQAKKDSHYIKFHDLYLDSVREGDAEPYSTGEQVVEALCNKIPDQLAHWSIQYEGRLALAERETAERYLQRCLFDNSLSLETMLEDSHMGKYLRDCIDEEQGQWRFPQSVNLILFGRGAKQVEELRRPMPAPLDRQ